MFSFDLHLLAARAMSLGVLQMHHSERRDRFRRLGSAAFLIGDLAVMGAVVWPFVWMVVPVAAAVLMFAEARHRRHTRALKALGHAVRALGADIDREATQ